MHGLAACSSEPAQGCARYALMESQCPQSLQLAVSRNASQFACSEAQSIDDDWLSRLQDREVLCAEQHDNCESYHSCKSLHPR